MLQAIRKIYRSIIPQELRRNVALQQWETKKQKLREEILRYYESVNASELNNEQKVAIEYLRTKPLHVFPSSFAERYNKSKVEVLHDASLNLRYVMFEGKRIYYKRGWSNERVKDYYNGLLQEQDVESPHRYLTKSFNISPNDSVADVGAAEGIFALSIVEKVERVYLFETDNEWLEALRATFKPFEHKVEIIHQAVSDHNDDKNTTLDSYFNTKQLDFIKIDIDGGERAALNGAQKLLSSNLNLKIALCAYHNQSDKAEFTELFKKNAFHVETSSGYMIFYFDKTLAPPYFRRGVLRALKRKLD